MADDEHYTELDISDVVNDSEQFLDSENPISEVINSDSFSIIQDSEVLESDEQIHGDKTSKDPTHKPELVRLTRLPIARIKNIMKTDPDVHLINADAVFLVTKATELFLETIVGETYSYTASKKRKTIAKKDLDTAINAVDCLCFLEGAMDF